MRKGLAIPLIFALLLVIQISPQIQAQDSIVINKGNLNVPLDRFTSDGSHSRWYQPPTIPDTSGWQSITVSGCDTTDNPGFNDGTCIQNALNQIDDDNGHIVYFPAGTYNINVSQGFKITNSRVVLRGESPSNTILKWYDRDGGTSCPDAEFGASYMYFGFCGSLSGSTLTWQNGFDTDNDIITLSDISTLAIGDWIRLRMDGAVNCLNGKTDNFMYTHTARVSCRNGASPCDDDNHLSANQIQLDRPLRMDYNDDPDCSSANKYARELSMLDYVGIEDLAWTHNNRAIGKGFTGYPLFMFVNNGWVDNTRWFSLPNEGVRLWFTRDMLIINSDGSINTPETTSVQTVNLGRGNTDSFVLNNRFGHSPTVVEAQQGTNGAVIAYNYFYNTDWCTHATFIHGRYSRGVLSEGNVAPCEFGMDATHGINGPYNTFYRNRMTDAASGARDHAGECFGATSNGLI